MVEFCGEAARLDQGAWQDLVAELKVNCPNSELVVGPEIPSACLTDFIGTDVGAADVYVKASSTQEVSLALRAAYKRKMPVTVRGAGTNLVGSTIPRGGMVLDVSGMKRVLELDEDNRTILVEPGLSAGSSRKAGHHRRQYCHQRRWHARGQVWCDP